MKPRRVSLTRTHRRCLGLGLLVVISALPGCGSPTPDQLAGDYADHLQQIADELEGISSQADADAAAGRIQPLVQESEGLAAKASAIEAQENKQLDSTVQARLTEQNARIEAAVSHLQDDGLMTDKLRGVLQQAQLAQP